MRQVEEKQEEMQKQPRGQIIIVLAAGMVGLLVAGGLAVDGGFLLMRQAQLERAVDISALSGVTEMAVGGLSACNERARQFLSANGVQVIEDEDFLGERRPADLPGAYRYRVSVDWESEVFFMRLIGFDNIPLHAEAEAEYYPQVDIYTGSTMETGVLQSSNQAVFGPQLCSDYGDPITPTNSQWHNDVDPPGVYTYRIMIPSSYPYDRVRVEIFDPDTYNQSANSATVQRINFTTFTGNCSNTDRKDPCMIATSETANPFWFMRIDENRGTGTNGQCGEPGSYTASYNTRTLYRLYYLRRMPDGGLDPVDLAYYIGERDGGTPSDAAEAAATDLMWVSPTNTASQRMPAISGYGPAEPAITPESCNAARTTYRPEVTQPCSGNGDFIIELSELADDYVDPNTGVRFIYLQVQGLTGRSENGFEFWAGPPRSVLQVPSNVNYRNLYVARYGPSAHSSAGVGIFGIGHLPMNSNVNNAVDIPLTYFGPEYAGETLRIQLFDADSGAEGPIYFRFDTIPLADWAACYGDNNGACQGRVGHDRLGPDQIPNSSVWTNPPYTLIIPDEEANGIPFYGGRLIANYQAGGSDTYGWRIVLESRPFLVD